MAIGDVSLTSAMRSNLVSLQSTEALLGRTQERLATGKKVNSAIDNPTNFFAARAHTQRADLLNGLKDNIGEAIQTVKASDSGVKAINSTIEALRGIVSQARSAQTSTTSATDLAGLTTQYNELVRQLNNTAEDSGYKGVNFLTSGALAVNFNEQASTKLQMQGFNGSASGLAISGGTQTGSGTLTSAQLTGGTALDGIETTLNAALGKLRTESAGLASNLSILTTRQQFITDMVNTLVDGAGKLTNADTNEEGANMLLLQTRQQLGVTALSLSAQAAQSVLRLF
ncbi:MAG: flagellin domain-containing protein [bacterium]|nr:MAG: flagellin domain-containing protein [bacterium]KAF0147223.1 MAG: flagellin domain-containing protein [bacterium]KAF0168089.1 MAG: flagellin domain-containing protein [bacterium]